MIRRGEKRNDWTQLADGKLNALDNISDFGGVVVSRIHRPLRRQSGPYLNCGSSDHLDLQPGHWTALVSAYPIVLSRSLIELAIRHQTGFKGHLLVPLVVFAQRNRKKEQTDVENQRTSRTPNQPPSRCPAQE